MEFSFFFSNLNSLDRFSCLHKSIGRDSSVGIETGYGLDIRSLILDRGNKCLFSPQCADQLWSSPNIQSNG
jgi:hypothetical protein